MRQDGPVRATTNALPLSSSVVVTVLPYWKLVEFGRIHVM